MLLGRQDRSLPGSDVDVPGAEIGPGSARIIQRVDESRPPIFRIGRDRCRRCGSCLQSAPGETQDTRAASGDQAGNVAANRPWDLAFGGSMMKSRAIAGGAGVCAVILEEHPAQGDAEDPRGGGFSIPQAGLLVLAPWTAGSSHIAAPHQGEAALHEAGWYDSEGHASSRRAPGTLLAKEAFGDRADRLLPSLRPSSARKHQAQKPLAPLRRKVGQRVGTQNAHSAPRQSDWAASGARLHTTRIQRQLHRLRLRLAAGSSFIRRMPTCGAIETGARRASAVRVLPQLRDGRQRRQIQSRSVGLKWADDVSSHRQNGRQNFRRPARRSARGRPLCGSAAEGC